MVCLHRNSTSFDKLRLFWVAICFIFLIRIGSVWKLMVGNLDGILVLLMIINKQKVIVKLRNLCYFNFRGCATVTQLLLVGICKAVVW